VTDEHAETYVVGYDGMIYRLDFTGTSFDDELTRGIPCKVPASLW